MTAEANKTPLSVDYTGRDYYAIRQQLIERVQDRVPDWQGNDANDFGLAIIEAFSYMGDMMNYYIDRVANESYILTATQRESLLNISSTYGYKPANYVSASVTLDLTSSEGYRGAIGGAIIEGDLDDEVSDPGLGNYCKVIVPNDHPYSVTGQYNEIKVNSMPSVAPATIGDKELTFATSVFNGTFPVEYVGYDNIGKNVIWYRPKATATGVALQSASITAAVADGTTVTYTSDHPFEVDQVVTITGFTSTGFNLTDATVATASATKFTVTNSLAAATATGTGTATDDTRFVITLSETGRTMNAYSDQKIFLSGVTVGSGSNYNGIWTVKSSTSATDTDAATITVDTLATDTVADITKAVVPSVDTTHIMYSGWHEFITGQKVTITGATTSSFNLSAATITSQKSIEAGVSRVVTDGTDVTYTVSEEFEAGDFVTIRNIKSVGNSLGEKDVKYNLSDQVISSVANVTKTIQSVSGNSTGANRITYETTTAHDFEQGDYVTISGVVNELVEDSIDKTDVFNLKAAKILSVTSDTTFVVEGYWDAPYDTGGTVTLYKFVLAGVAVTGDFQSTGSAVSQYFKVAKPGGFTDSSSTFTDGKATINVGGTWSAGGSLVYAEIPALIVSGPFVTNIGSTVVPKGSQVITQVNVDGSIKDVIFSTQANATVPYRESASVLAIHGEEVSFRTDNLKDTTVRAYDIDGELLGYSSGKADQMFALTEVQVNPRSVRLFIDTGVEWEEWAQVEHIQDYSPSAKIFEVSVAANEEVSVRFGDGISGEIPTKESGIKAVYISGGGAVGNVAAGTLTQWNLIQGTEETTIRNSITVRNALAATGGADPETNDSIRYNAPRSLRALNRAVTLSDFSALALSVDGIAKANATAGSRSAVSVYIAPTNQNSDSTTPGVDQDGGATPQMEIYKTLVTDYLADRKQIGTTVTVLEPNYSDVYVQIKLSYLPQYNAGAVSKAVQKAILDDFSYDNLDFEDVITPEEIEFKVRQVDGVSSAKITGLYRVGGNGRNSLLGDPYEIFVFSQANIEVIETSSVASLNTVTFKAYAGAALLDTPTRVPAINGDVYSYSLSLPATTDKLVVETTTLEGSGKPSVAVNDWIATYDSGTGKYTMTFDDNSETDPQELPIPQSTLIITVTAEDGVTVKSYKFKVTIES